jgi:hypothetical protein
VLIPVRVSRYYAPTPTVLRVGPFRFFFYAGDGDEPPHIHVERDHGEAKFWLDPIRLERSRGLRRNDASQIRELIEEHAESLLESWNDFFNGQGTRTAGERRQGQR